jgi:SNF2 family DNA or RNA helicase
MLIAAFSQTDKQINVTADEATLRVIQQIPGAKRVRTMADTWSVPFSIDVCAELRSLGADMAPDLAAAVVRLGKVAAYVEHVKLNPGIDVLKPAPIAAPYTLYAHQRQAYNIGLVLPEFAAFMDMGTGKTLVTVMITGRRYLDGKIKRVLIVAPASVCPVWPAEYAKFAAFPYRVALILGTHEKRLQAIKTLTAPVPLNQREPLRVAVINYESTWRLPDELKDFNADMIVCDESQRIKSPTAHQSKAMWALGDQARYKMLLTGTPIQKDTRDVWSQYRFLAPNVFATNYYSFQARYTVMGGFNGKQYLGPRNLPELTRKTHSIAFRVRKEECLDLPDQIFEDRPVLLDEKSMALYRQIQKQSLAELENGTEITANHVLVRMLRLQQITGGVIMGDDGYYQRVNTAKLDALLDIVESMAIGEGRKIVIYSRFLEEMNVIEAAVTKMLAAEGLSMVRIDGGVKPEARGDIVARFQTDPACRLFLGEIDACAVGITLHAAYDTVYYSINFNYVTYDQSLSRIHRIGQTHKCTYINLICPGTIDEKIIKAVKAKESLAKSVVDNWRTLLGD